MKKTSFVEFYDYYIRIAEKLSPALDGQAMQVCTYVHWNQAMCARKGTCNRSKFPVNEDTSIILFYSWTIGPPQLF